jgi:CheY-like chemotaxis protein
MKLTKKSKDKKLNILIIDDNLPVCVFFKRLFKDKHNVDVVVTGEEALEKVKEEQYDIVFLDINLPDINGTELMPKIKEYNPNAIITFTSAYNLNDAIKSKLESENCEFIEKPFKDIVELENVTKKSR